MGVAFILRSSLLRQFSLSYLYENSCFRTRVAIEIFGESLFLARAVASMALVALPFEAVRRSIFGKRIDLDMDVGAKLFA